MHGSRRSDILELPRIFMNAVLWNLHEGIGNVRPEHYTILMDLLVRSSSLADFLKRTEEPESIWKRLRELDSIHENVLDKELRSLKTLAESASVKALSTNMARMCSL